jgi:hypothetical protein
MAGIGEADDRLPDYMMRQSLPPTNERFNIPDDQMSGFYGFADPELLKQL